MFCFRNRRWFWFAVLASLLPPLSACYPSRPLFIGAILGSVSTLLTQGLFTDTQRICTRNGEVVDCSEIPGS